MENHSAIKKLEDVLTNTYSQFIRAWDVTSLGHKQKTMAYALAAQQVVQRLPDVITEDDARFLLGLKAPLDAVASEWVKAMGLEQIDDQVLLASVRNLHEAQTHSQDGHAKGMTMG